jgi:hypothetical protein
MLPRAAAAGTIRLTQAASTCFVDAAGVPTITLGWLLSDSAPGALITQVSFELDAPATVDTQGAQVPGGTLSDSLAVPPSLGTPGSSIVANIRLRTTTPGGQTVTGYGDWTERHLQVSDSAGNTTMITDDDPALKAAGFPLAMASAAEVAANCSSAAPPRAVVNQTTAPTPTATATASTSGSTAQPAPAPTATPLEAPPAATVAPPTATQVGATPTPSATPTDVSIIIEDSAPTPKPTAAAQHPRPAGPKATPSAESLTVRALVQPVHVGAVETLAVSGPPAALLQLTAEYPYPGGHHRVTQARADKRGNALLHLRIGHLTAGTQAAHTGAGTGSRPMGAHTLWVQVDASWTAPLPVGTPAARTTTKGSPPTTLRAKARIALAVLGS